MKCLDLILVIDLEAMKMKIQHDKARHSLGGYPAQVKPLKDLWSEKSLLIRQEGGTPAEQGGT